MHPSCADDNDGFLLEFPAFITLTALIPPPLVLFYFLSDGHENQLALR